MIMCCDYLIAFGIRRHDAGRRPFSCLPGPSSGVTSVARNRRLRRGGCCLVAGYFFDGASQGLNDVVAQRDCEGEVLSFGEALYREDELQVNTQRLVGVAVWDAGDHETLGVEDDAGAVAANKRLIVVGVTAERLVGADEISGAFGRVIIWKAEASFCLVPYDVAGAVGF